MASVESETIGNNILIPVIVSLSGLVLILTIVIIIVCCRRNFRRTESMAQDAEAAIKIKPMSESAFINAALEVTPSVSRQGSTTSSNMLLTENNDGYLTPTLHRHTSPKPDNIPPQQEVTDPGSPLAEPVIRFARPPPPKVEPRPESTLSTLAPLRPRGHSGESMIQDDKDSTLRRVSNIFKSDTQAAQFYNSTMRNYEMDVAGVLRKQQIGRGHFGCVYIGSATKLPTSKEKNVMVAIKTMKSSAPDSDKQEFLYELEIMKLVTSLNHPNIIRLLACVTRTEPNMILLELMPNGNLQKFLRDAKLGNRYYNLRGDDSALTGSHLLKFALDIARGMDGIASLQLLHRDLAARNILLDADLTCKVADFGFAKDVLKKPEYKSKSVFQRPRPTRWLSPESLFAFKHSIQSDVWSYGIVLWEIVTLGNLPYPQMETREVSPLLTFPLFYSICFLLGKE